MNRASAPYVPSDLKVLDKLPCTSPATWGRSLAYCTTTATNKIACVSRNMPNTGAIVETDSLTPRKFITVSNASPANVRTSLYACQLGGKKLKSASAPAAIDTVIVKT